MNIVFFGTSEFAVPSLKSLLGSTHKVRLVVTQPDRAKGRDLKVSKSPVKVMAEMNRIQVHQPLNASSVDSTDLLRDLGADVFVVVSFGQILSKDLLTIPKFCAINLHASLLPKYRGASPINRAVMDGGSETGITIMRMNEKLDEGDVVLQRTLAIRPEDTSITISEELAEVGGRVLLEAIDLIGYGKAVYAKQDESKATYAEKLKKDDGLIDWKEGAEKIHNKVRGLLPWPGAYTRLNGKILKIYNTEVIVKSAYPDAAPGEVIDITKGRGMTVHTGSGDIVIKYLQLEGKKILDVDAFLRGHRIPLGHRF